MEVTAAAAPTGGRRIINNATAAASSPSSLSRILSRRASSSSFRLRSPSLNSLRLRRIFDIFDKNSDGKITVTELQQALDLLGLEADHSELESIVASYVEPGSDGLRFEDFVSLHESLDETFFHLNEGNMEEEAAAAADESKNKNISQEDSDLSEAFKVFDEDGDGFISAHELQVVLGKLGLVEGKEIGRVQQMIGSVDRNHDGRVDFFEFKNMMQSVIVHSG